MNEETFMSLLATYGPLGIIAAIVCFFVLRYGPRIIEGHLSLTKTCETTQLRMADALETMSESQTSSASHHSKTHRALVHIATAYKKTDAASEVHQELNRAIQILSNE